MTLIDSWCKTEVNCWCAKKNYPPPPLPQKYTPTSPKCKVSISCFTNDIMIDHINIQFFLHRYKNIKCSFWWSIICHHQYIKDYNVGSLSACFLIPCVSMACYLNCICDNGIEELIYLTVNSKVLLAQFVLVIISCLSHYCTVMEFIWLYISKLRLWHICIFSII